MRWYKPGLCHVRYYDLEVCHLCIKPTGSDRDKHSIDMAFPAGARYRFLLRSELTARCVRGHTIPADTGAISSACLKSEGCY
jgi:hypothetical protein